MASDFHTDGSNQWSAPSPAPAEGEEGAPNLYYQIRTALQPHMASDTDLIAAETDVWAVVSAALSASRAEVERLTKERDEWRQAAKVEAGLRREFSADRDRMTEALRENFCPRPCNNRPDDFTVGQCVDASECGCMNLAALNAEKRDGGAG